jgi:anti-sigma regulatory factor (Ser/Thr protein kinase)
VIKEYASLVRDGVLGPVTDKQARYLNVVDDRADDLNTMVDDMLDVSKLESGMMGLYRRQCRVEDVVAHVRPALDRKALVKGVRLEYSLEDSSGAPPAASLPDVYCDPDKAGRVLVNLVVNAIKFCGEPGHVRVSAERSAAGRDIVIRVSDNGPGISQHDIERLFRRFRQLGTQARGSTKGFGLGLSIAKELVDLNFGEIHVESTRGSGSTFSFTLPVADAMEVLRRYLSRLAQAHHGSHVVSLIHAAVDGPADAVPDHLANDVDAFLNYLLRRTDLLIRCDARSWLLALPAPSIELDKFYTRARKTLGETNRNRLRGPLPEFSLTTMGTWRVAEQRDEVLGRAASLLSGELIHA